MERRMQSHNEITNALNDVLRHEIACVEAYSQALRELMTVPAEDLEHCRSLHQHQVALLKQRVRALGGIPEESAGMWGLFARLLQGGADALGSRAGLTALEDSENRGLGEYRRILPWLDAPNRQLVVDELLPGQLEIHVCIRAAKQRLP
jgi:hypothetical protein